jgi:hypothetical protein
MITVLISFLVRFSNWMSFKFMTFPNWTERQSYFMSVFLMIDNTASTIFLLNAYFFCFEVKRVHEQLVSKSYQEY